MKKRKAIGIIMAIILLTTGCGGTSSTGTKTAQPQVKEKKTIALVMKTLANSFFVEMEKGARKAETELGIKLTVKTGANETSIEEQIAIVEELIEEKVDAIVIAPGSSTELIPILKKAQDNKIVIVNIDNRLDPTLGKKAGLANVPFISVDNEKGGYLSGKYLSGLIKKPTEVAILEGIRGADNAEQRKNGAIRAFKENANIKIVASETANWKIDEALSVFTGIFAKHRNIGAVFCANDMMALGVVEYKKKSNADFLLGGFDNLTEAKLAIKEGKMQVTIDQQADVQGYTGIKYAYDLIDGKKVPSETMIQVKVMTKSNIN